MRIRIAVFFIIFYTIQCIYAQVTLSQEIVFAPRPLDNVINELCSIARLTNGIAIQMRLREKDVKAVDDVIAEFLGVQKGQDLHKLRKIEVEGVGKDLKEFYEIVEKIPELRVDVKELKDGWEAVERMKEEREVLEKVVKDPQLKADVDKASQMSLSTNMEVSDFHQIIEKLGFIKKNEYSKESEPFYKYLYPLKGSVKVVLTQVEKFGSFETKMEELFKLQNMSAKFEDIEKISRIARPYAQFYDAISSMEQKFEEVNGMDFQPFLDKIGSLSTLSRALWNSTISLPMVQSDWKRQKTAGLPKGIGDLKVLFGDLRSGIGFRALIGVDRDIGLLLDSLGLLEKFQDAIGQVKTHFDVVFKPANVKTLEDTIDLLANSSTLNSMDSGQVSNSLESIKLCFKDLKPIPTAINFTEIDNIVKIAKTVTDQIAKFKVFLEKHKTDFNTQKSAIASIENILLKLEPATRNSTEEEKVWNQLKQKDHSELIKILGEIHGGFEEFKTENAIVTMQTKMEWDEVTKVVKSLENTNLKTVLTCLHSTTYDSTVITKVLGIGARVQEFKARKGDFESTEIYLKKLGELKKSLEDIGKLKRSRKRRSQASPITLQNAFKISEALSRGIQVLRDFTKILNNEKSVDYVVHTPDAVKQFIDTISHPEVRSIWTNDNRKMLKDMLEGIKNLEFRVANSPNRNLSQVFKAFEEGEKLKGHDLDAKFFGDPIAKNLSQGNKLLLVDAKTPFQEVSTLNLNFAQHHVNLKSAHGTFTPIQTFFDGFFASGNANGDGDADRQDDSRGEATDITWIFYSATGLLCLGVIIAVVVVIYIFNERRLLYYRRQDPERYWVYQTPQCAPCDTTWLPIACYANKIKNVKKLLKEGQNMNTFYKKQPCIYWAIKHQNVEMAELLLKFGADPLIECEEKCSIQVYLDSMIRDATDYKDRVEGALHLDAKRLKRIKKVFIKYRKKNPEPYVPKLIPVETFSIRVCDEYNGPFRDVYAKLIYSEDTSSRRTHNAVKCNEEGVFDIDELTEVRRPEIEQKTDEMKDEKIKKEIISKKMEVERLDMEVMDKKRKLVNLVFDFALMVDSRWLDACVESKRAFYQDYDKYRVRKVKYGGKVYKSVDLWRKWMAGRAIPCLEGAMVYFHLSDGKKPSCMIAETIGAKVVDKCHDAMIHGASSSNRRLYWDTYNKSVFFVQVDGEQTDEWIVNMEMVKAQNTSMTEEGYYQYLLEQNGMGIGKLDDEEEERRKKKRKCYKQKSSEQIHLEDLEDQKSTAEKISENRLADKKRESMSKLKSVKSSSNVAGTPTRASEASGTAPTV